MSLRRLAIIAVVPVVAALQPTFAQDNHFKIFGAASYVSPLSDEDVDFGTVRESVQAANDLGWEFGFEWRANKLIGLEASYLNVTQDVEVDGDTIGDVDLTPWNASLNFHILPTKVVDFWVGPSVAYVKWSNVNTDSGPVIETDDEFAYGASLGIDIGLGETVAITGGLRWLKMDLPLEDLSDVGVDPLFARVGLALRF